MAVLLKVVEAGSLSAAAKRLDVPLATVRRRVAELDRGASENAHAEPIEPSSSLTEAGRVYVEVCERIPEQVEEADRAAMGVHKEPKGRLCVTVNWQDVRISERVPSSAWRSETLRLSVGAGTRNARPAADTLPLSTTTQLH